MVKTITKDTFIENLFFVLDYNVNYNSCDIPVNMLFIKNRIFVDADYVSKINSIISEINLDEQRLWAFEEIVKELRILKINKARLFIVSAVNDITNTEEKNIKRNILENSLILFKDFKNIKYRFYEDKNYTFVNIEKNAEIKMFAYIYELKIKNFSIITNVINKLIKLDRIVNELLPQMD